MLADIHTESLAELLAQVYSERVTPNGPHILGSSLGRGDIVEIQGGPSSGKTHLLFHLIIDCILPSQHAGWADVAVVFDMDHSFNIIRLNHLLLSRLTRAGGLNASAAESVAQQSLKRLLIFKPSSTLELAATLSHLARHHSSQFSRQKIGIVAIDSVSSRYWPDRFVAEQMRSSLTSHIQPGSKHVTSLHHMLLALESFSRTHRPLIIMTNWGLHSLNNSAPSFYRQHLQPFPTLPSLRLAQSNQSTEINMLLPHPKSMPSLTSHITLQNIDTDVRCNSFETQGGLVQFAMLLRKSGSSVVKFTLSISDDDISVTDQSMCTTLYQ